MTAVLIWIVRLLVILLIVRLVMRALASRRLEPTRRSQPPQRIGGTLVRDPQCGTYIPEARAVILRAGSGTVHFCSSTCRDAWTATRMRNSAS
jgi:uncharacterized protein